MASNNLVVSSISHNQPTNTSSPVQPTCGVMDVFDSPEVLALGLAGFLTAHGVRKKSLSPSGAVAAFLVGFFMMSVPNFRTPGTTMIVFYLLGSSATKIGQLAKGRLEEGHAVAGYRDASQVSLSHSCTCYAIRMYTACT